MAGMFTVKVITGFNAAHRLRNYRGMCERLHGHNWKVEIIVASPALVNGMVMDFKVLKCMAAGIMKRLDHRYLNGLSYFKKENPTSEHIARFIALELVPALKKKGAVSLAVSVWETETSVATYMQEL